MEQLATGILRRSSDAVVIISLADGRILDVNEAFFTLTGSRDVSWPVVRGATSS
jgi:PAS domain-containing protein